MNDQQQLLDSLDRVTPVLSAFVATIPTEKRDLCRGEGFWTINEHVSHLAEVQPMLLERLQRFMDEVAPAFVPFVPDSDTDESEPIVLETAAALKQFADYRQRQLDLLARVESSTWQKTATHPEYAHYSFYILVRHILMHDYWHMYRMEELWLTHDGFLTDLQ